MKIPLEDDLARFILFDIEKERAIAGEGELMEGMTAAGELSPLNRTRFTSVSPITHLSSREGDLMICVTSRPGKASAF